MRLTILAIAFLAATPALAQEAMPFECDGALGPDMTHDGLAAEFGGDNVSFTEVQGDEGTRPLASVVFPTDPTRRLSVVWRDEAARQRPLYVIVGPDSNWTVDGLSVGMRIDEVEALNGKPFSVSGFDDIGRGRVDGWEGGKLRSEMPGCEVQVNFGYRALGLPSSLAGTVNEQGPFPSDDPALQALGARITEITVSYPAPE